MALETVYAVHSFEAENDDEIPFQIGEPIIVLEKDDLYGDSWWKGKNTHGQVGLFPMTYISYERPPPLSPINLPSLSTSNDSARENLRPATPISALNGSDLELPLPAFRMPSPSIDETIDDIQDKLQRMAVRTEEEQIYQNKLSQQHHAWAPKSGYSSKLYMASSSGSSSISSRMSSTGKLQSSPHSPFESVGSAKRVGIPSTSGTVNEKQMSHPANWDVNQVCTWLSERGFESEVYHFVDNDITGDVLIGLSISTLLKELNITSFGKRVHIMNAINELRSQFSLSNENDDVSDMEEYHNTQTTSLYPDQLLLNTQNGLYSNQTADLGMNLHQYGVASNLSLPQINGFPRHMIESPRTSTSNLARNFPPTYYTHSQRVDDAEGANIETISPRSSNKKDRIFAKLNLKNMNNPVKKKDRTRSAGAWDFNKDRNSLVGNTSKRSTENSDYLENADGNEDMIEENFKSIANPDYKGWLKKQGDKYKTWKSRYCILKGAHLYYFKNDKETGSSNVKGRINLTGYRVIPDENILHGKYGVKLLHDAEKSHYFAHEEKDKMKGWMKAMMKATIARDSRAPVISSSNIATVPLSEARKLTPRPPDPRRPSVSSTAINVTSSPIIRPRSPSSPQRTGSPILSRPLSPLTTPLTSPLSQYQTIHNSSPLVKPLSSRTTGSVGFF